MEDYKENLKTYIKEDIIYQEYLKNKNKNFSDFDKFCIQHCKDIEELLEENEKLKDKLSKIETLIINHNCDTGDIYYKYNSRFLKSKLKQRILEIVYEKESDSNEKR